MSSSSLSSPQAAWPPFPHAATWAKPVRPWNPLHDDLRASRRSSYLGVMDGQLRRLLARDADYQPCEASEAQAHRHIADHILDKGFPCVAAKSILNRASFRMGVYDKLGSAETALPLCHDLYEFSHEFGQSASRQDKTRFTSFIAAFPHTDIESELAFEQLLWRQLQAMHGVDARYFDWDGAVSKEPDSPEFSFSLGGRAFFVVGLHPRASRLARRADIPCLVFNPHEQFDALRSTGKYDQLRDAIRERDIAFQGSINPMLSNFGQASESRQYAGRAVSAQWKCPFHPQSTPADEARGT